jgi:hypothetical protein
MDKHNLFFTPTTYGFLRLDHLVMLVALSGLVLAHWSEVNWLHFVAAFLWSDLVGTFPGLYWYYARSSGERRRIPKVFYLLYNIGHSFLSIGLVTVLWYLIAGRLEWAMLAMPIHLTGDRSVFGNFYKPFGLAFEPHPHDGFVRFQKAYEESGRW